MADGNCWDSADPALISPAPGHGHRPIIGQNPPVLTNQRPVFGPISHKDTIKEPGALQVSKVEHHLFTQIAI